MSQESLVSIAIRLEQKMASAHGANSVLASCARRILRIIEEFYRNTTTEFDNQKDPGEAIRSFIRPDKTTFAFKTSRSRVAPLSRAHADIEFYFSVIDEITKGKKP